MTGTRSISDLLAEQETFAGLADADLELIAGCGRNEAFPVGTRILREGEQADRFYVLRTGRVALELAGPERGPITIEVIGPGDVLGWSWLVPPYRWHLDATALEEVHAIGLDGACLRDKLAADPRLGYELLQRFARIIVDRLQHARLRLLDLYGPGT